MGVVVAAAGSLLGGLAAKAAGADKGKVAPSGGGIDGLTSSKGAGKLGNGAGYAIQVDPSKSLAMYQTAVKQYTDISTTGLNQYLPALKTAANQISQGYAEGNTTLQPVAYAGVQALNEQMRMLGMDPLPATAKYSDAIGQQYNQIADRLPGFKDQVHQFQSQLREADKIRDPDQRTAEKDTIEQAFSKFQADAGVAADAQLKSWMTDHPSPGQIWYDRHGGGPFHGQTTGYMLDTYGVAAIGGGDSELLANAHWDANGKLVGANKDYEIKALAGTGPNYAPMIDSFGEYAIGHNTVLSPDYDPTKPTTWEALPDQIAENASGHSLLAQQGIYNEENVAHKVAAWQAQSADWNKQLAAQKQQIQDLKDSYIKPISDVENQWASDYAPTYDAGYTGKQVEEKVASLPGYQFQMDQGTKAIERQGAAHGMLGSANTELGLQSFGQQLGMNYYQQYMTYLQGVSAQGLGANAQIAANQVSQGSSLAGLTQQAGLAQWQNAQMIAQQAYNANAASAELFNRTSMFNAAAQNASINKQQDAMMGATNAAIGAAPGMMNAQNNANIITAQYQQQQAMGAGMNYAANGGGGNNGFTYYGSAKPSGYLSFM